MYVQIQRQRLFYNSKCGSSLKRLPWRLFYLGKYSCIFKKKKNLLNSMFQSFVFLPFVTKCFKELANDLGMKVEVADSKRASIFIICEKFIKSFLFWSPFHCVTSCILATGPYE